MKEDIIPITPALVEYLERVYPDRCPDPDSTDREVWLAVGRAQVVRMLRTRLNEQEENVLER